ncbi:organic cation transporter-like protein [Centruroides sculpturatus]|uniref:organic cation transporter-like protein n=1 Tax=Centruroides sculpturatus TaxID=218467 RepID=UPI000C6EAE20|nr:organic cation transporter-like protein [Centruroides sculpturatus]
METINDIASVFTSICYVFVITYVATFVIIIMHTSLEGKFVFYPSLVVLVVSLITFSATASMICTSARKCLEETRYFDSLNLPFIDKMRETAKEFQDFTDLIGPFGKWQKILIGIMAWSLIVSALNNLNWPFLAYKVDYWCARTPKYMNVSVEDWKNISLPLEIRNGRKTHSRCEVYDIDDAKYGKNFSKIPCRSWEYDHSQYKNSVIEKWNLVCESSWLSSLAGSSYFVGFFVSGILSGQISDRYGRRPVIISGLVLHITFGILCSFSPYYWLFTVSRFFLSAGITFFHLTFYVYGKTQIQFLQLIER